MDEVPSRLLGIVIAASALLFALGEVAHPPEGSADETFATTAAQAGMWRVSHTLVSLGALGLAAGALAALSATRLARSQVGRFGLALVVVGGAGTLVAGAVETFVAPAAALAGDRALWNAGFAVTHGLVVFGVVPLLAGWTLVAAHEAASPARVANRWAAGAAVVLGALGVLGHVGVYGFDVRALMPMAIAALGLLLFVASLGLALARAPRLDDAAEPARTPA